MRQVENVFWRAVGIGIAADFIAMRLPAIGGLLAWVALGWAGWWFVQTARPRVAAWIWAAVVGACAAVGGLLAGLVLGLILSLVHPLGLPGALLGFLGSLFGLLFAIPQGLIAGALGGYLASRGSGRRPWRRWDPDA